MTSTHHASFTIERFYVAAPAKVFAAWSDLSKKQRWFKCADDWVVQEHSLDFRVGGREVYRDIVPNERIVYSCDMRLDATHISVSLLTVELRSEGTGTRLTFTEQGAYLDGYDDVAGREEGTRIGLENLARSNGHSGSMPAIFIISR